jgi:hypothetical protein
MPRSVFAQHLALAVLMALKNRVELAFLADGRRRAMTRDRAIHADELGAWPE